MEFMDTGGPRTRVVLEGWVLKQSRHLKEWRPRWLILTEDANESYLRSFVQPSSSGLLPAHPTEAVTLSEAHVLMPTDALAASPARGSPFAVQVGGRVFCYACVSEAACSDKAAPDEAAARRWIEEVGKRCAHGLTARRSLYLSAGRWFRGVRGRAMSVHACTGASEEDCLRRIPSWLAIARAEAAAGALPTLEAIECGRGAPLSDAALAAIEIDVERCRPSSLPETSGDEIASEAVRRILRAWLVRSQTYDHSLGFVAAMAVHVLRVGRGDGAGFHPVSEVASDAFVLFGCLLSRLPPRLHDLASGAFRNETAALGLLLEVRLPHLFSRAAGPCAAREALPLLCLSWLLPVWSNGLPLSLTLAVWDVILTEESLASPDRATTHEDTSHGGCDVFGGAPIVKAAERGDGAELYGRGALFRTRDGGAGCLRVAVALCFLAEDDLEAELRQPSTSAHLDPATFCALLVRAVQPPSKTSVASYLLADVDVSLSDAADARALARGRASAAHPQEGQQAAAEEPWGEPTDLRFCEMHAHLSCVGDGVRVKSST